MGLGLNARRDSTIILNVRTQVADYAIDPSRLARYVTNRVDAGDG